ncbi:hypothetical protein HO173_007091 [Letharia columbiana]|uniref:LysM domain-containing protein n=1 Tax=Letharia columbiana TaxID=112416 RepID=A0A8H6FUD9_9LECA|nr:uncharacterized protein HO173_007091 [Letharia columbiana]KAF6234871.1 hypothetical protein HO173_007091 [Letharia columbiana]
MRSSSGMSTIFQTYIFFALSITSEVQGFRNDQAAITPPPAVATLVARDQVVLGACGPFDHWITVAAGASCESVASDNEITMDEFLLMNPNISPSCDNLIAGNQYCIGTGPASPPSSTIPSSTSTPPPPPSTSAGPTPTPTTTPPSSPI